MQTILAQNLFFILIEFGNNNGQILTDESQWKYAAIIIEIW